MLKIGLTGGYATGKSFVASRFERLGCHLIYADQLGRAVQRPDGEAYTPIVEAFGSEILIAGGAIDRKKLADIVFASPERLAKLNSLVHPAVFRLEEQMLASFYIKDPHGIVVLEAAILIETGRFAVFDRIILTACDEETQIARGMKRDGLSREQVLARLSRQMSPDEKKKHAHYIVSTSGPKEDTLRIVEQIYLELKTLAEASQ